MAEVLTAQAIWRRLSKAQRAALLAAYPDGRVTAHPSTLAALQRHELTADDQLTEAGRLIARWNKEC